MPLQRDLTGMEQKRLIGRTGETNNVQYEAIESDE